MQAKAFELDGEGGTKVLARFEPSEGAVASTPAFRVLSRDQVRAQQFVRLQRTTSASLRLGRFDPPEALTGSSEYIR
jgi:hypothetical protein